MLILYLVQASFNIHASYFEQEPPGKANWRCGAIRIVLHRIMMFS